MRIDRCIGDHHAITHPYTIRCEIPYAFDTGGYHGIGYILSAVDRNRNYADAYIELFNKFFQFVYMVDRYAAYL